MCYLTTAMKQLTEDCPSCDGEGMHLVCEDNHEYEHICYVCSGTGKMTVEEATAYRVDLEKMFEESARTREFERQCAIEEDYYAEEGLITNSMTSEEQDTVPERPVDEYDPFGDD